MRDALAILDEAEARLAPLSLATNLAWWESQVSATEENADRRTRAELAWSGALGDRELFAAVVAARVSGVNGEAGRRLDLLHDLMLTHQVPDDLRGRIVEPSPRSTYASRVTAGMWQESRSMTPRSSGSCVVATIRQNVARRGRRRRP